jgi:glutathione S-transferase
LVPTGTLPAIEVDGWVLSESEVINEYLEQCYPTPAMLPPDPALRARVRFLSRFHDLYLEPRVRALFPLVKAPLRAHEQVVALRADIAFRLQQLEELAQPQPYLLTPDISLADCGPLVTLPLAVAVLAACGQPLELPCGLKAWHDNASRHPGVQRALSGWRTATLAWLGT